ncbi:hypothetical protein [uncultured Secundilactobacillus sp.]|uniref:hypothetical protein n=1 Tax=uncultured Secundilactobacillus sp. TaxID=2813935 RepID=UPI0025956619|nr:hypothetical protein [uncultured Secundilactobacillus sp.]
MSRELTIIIAVVVAVVIYILIHRGIVNRATRRAHEQALLQTESAMRAALQRLVDDHFVSDQTVLLSRTTVADGWGRGVMAFEFVVKLPTNSGEQLQIFRQQLNRMLSDYASDHDIKTASPAGGSAFLVTDIWQHGDRVHMSVAYLVNEATIEYLKDLHKVDQRD